MNEAQVEMEKQRAKEARRIANEERRAAQTNPKTASWYKNNPATQKAKAAERYRANKEAISAYAKAYREANADRIRVSRAEYRAKNREKILAGKAAWRRANLDVHRIYDHNRRERMRRSANALSRDLVGRLFHAQKGRCACCGRRLGKDFHVDHIVPLARGGENIDRNTQLLRGECNLRKGAQDPIDYMQRKGRLL